MITETWLNPEITDCEIKLPGMSLLRTDRTGMGGGVILYYNTSLRCEVIDHPEIRAPDSLWCRLWLRNKDTCLLAVVYRPPNSTSEMDSKLYHVFQFALNKSYTHILIAGDFNVHDIETPATDGTQFKACLQELIAIHPLYNHVTSPTRFRTSNKPSILDLVLTNEELMVGGIVTSTPLGRSDHVTLLFDYICYAEYPEKEEDKVHTVTHYNVLSKLVKDTSWTFLFECPPDLAWEMFTRTLSTLVAQASEQKSFQPKNQSKSILRSRTRKCMSRRDLAWRNHQGCPNAETWTAYVTHRNFCVKLIREDKVTHQQKLMKRFCTNHKLLYRHINGLRKVKRGVPALVTADGYTRSAMEAADILRLHYSQTFQQVSSPNIHLISNTPPFGLENITFTTEAVLKKLLSLRIHSSPGADNIRPKALKAVASDLAEPLTVFYQRCLEENLIPPVWKQGVITPIHKGGSRTDPANYRPITLLPVLSKVMESIVADALMQYLESHNLIAPEQHGFRQKHSCNTNLLIARNSWTEAVDDGVGVDVIYLDFPKRLI
ncbi:unnamed protein product, partial [Dicrocoelium dendriticum]